MRLCMKYCLVHIFMVFYQYINKYWYRKSANICQNRGPCLIIDLRNLELVVLLWSSMASCGNSKIGRWQRRGELSLFWSSWVLLPFWIIWGGIWRSNGSACGTKPGAPSCLAPKGPRLTTAWKYPTPWVSLLLNPFPPPPSLWLVGMGYWSEIEDILLYPGSHLGPKYGWSRRLPRRIPWCAPPGWKLWFGLVISGISKYNLRIVAPWNSHLWEWKVIIGHYNQVPRLVPR